METSYCSANQRTGFYMITASVMKELKMRELLSAMLDGHIQSRMRLTINL